MNNMGKIVNANTVQIERLLPGPIERVWDFISKPELLSTWLMPATIELEVGGRVQLVDAPIPEGIFEDVQVVAQPTIIRGLVTECQPPRLLTYTWNESNYAVATTVRFELQEHGEQVLLVLTHSRLSQEFMAAVAAGWHVNVDALLAVLKGESRPEFYPSFNKLLEDYKILLAAAGVVAASVSVSPVMASGLDDSEFQLVKQQRQVLLVKYDRLWQDADYLKSEMQILERSGQTGGAMDALYRRLKLKYQDLHDIELDLRDLEKAMH